MIRVYKTCSEGKTCTLDVGHSGPCVQQRMPHQAGGASDTGHDLVSRAPWRKWRDDSPYEPEVWERKGWR